MFTEDIVLTHAEIARYDRHLSMPDIGIEGQKKLKHAKVLIIGAGGLGSPLALYLAAAGVGTLGLLDFDLVEESNLQRQIIHSTQDLGRPKVASAKEKINGLNPHVNVMIHNVRLTDENAVEIMDNYDIIADAVDNFPTRYLINDTCVLLGKPNVYGAVFQFDGQASVFCVKGGPCLRCLHPLPPGLVPAWRVLGVLPGIVGTIQAAEVIKLLIGGTSSLSGRLLVFDAWRMTFRTLNLAKDPMCPVCGGSSTIS